MKRACIFFMIISISTSLAQYNFSVSPGMTTNAASFGYVMDDFLPYIGVQYLSGNLSEKYHFMEYDYENDVYGPSDRDIEAGVSILMPYVGFKYFISSSDKLKTYANGMITYPIITTSSSEETPEEIDNINAFAFEIGFGTEYYFHTSFSIGGEFGFRYLTGGTEYTVEDYYYNGNEDINYNQKHEWSANLNSTYAKLNLNFYFE